MVAPQTSPTYAELFSSILMECSSTSDVFCQGVASCDLLQSCYGFKWISFDVFCFSWFYSEVANIFFKLIE